MGQVTARAANACLNPEHLTEECFAATARARQKQRTAMNHLLFNPELLRRHCGPGGRVVIFAFARAAGVLMTRFLQAGHE